MTFKISICGLAAMAFGALLSVAPVAQAEPDKYDGTGSQFHSVTPPKADEDKKDKRSRDTYETWEAALRKSAASGDANKMAALGAILEYGFGTTGLDRTGAFDLYEKAADKGSVIGRQKMCVAYLLGEGRPVNVSKGMDYCNVLGVKDPAGLFGGGYDYANGISGPKDEGLAMAAYIQAGKLGSGEAMDAIGRKVVELGKPDLARKWYRQGAILGAADAMDDLAGLFERGEGGEVDKAGAYWLYVNAARRGNAHALAWVAALPESSRPLERVNLYNAEKAMIMETVTDKQGSHTRPFDLRTLGPALSRYYPGAAVEGHIDGTVLLHCYIDGDHDMDICLVQNEYPAGYAFGPIMMAVFDKPLSVVDQDTEGHPTAHTVMPIIFHWTVN